VQIASRSDRATGLPPVPEPTGFTEGDELLERRRAGRLSYPNPHLIAMLRGEAPSAAGLFTVPSSVGGIVDRVSSETDELTAARGIAVAALISGILWAAALAGPSVLLGLG
jgi:hypothetical protein